jgi:hypothetical protein
MFGTLIGIFISATAIVIGADSAVSMGNGTVVYVDKTCLLDSTAVATIQGEYGIPLVGETTFPWLFNSFKSICELSKKMNVPLEEQAHILIEELRAQLQANMTKLDRVYLNKRFGKDPHVNYVSVSGYENGKPRVLVQELILDRSQEGQWKPTVKEAQNLSQKKCGVKFHGEDWIANYLLQDFYGPVPFPRSELDGEEVIAGFSSTQTGSCLYLTERKAIKLFETAVRLTMKYHRKEGMQGGHVGGELDVWVIPLEGKAKHYRLPQSKP